MKTVAVGACLFFTVMNLPTVKGTGRMQGPLVGGPLGIPVLYVIGGAREVHAARFSPFFTSGWRLFFAVTGMVFISYGGPTKVVDVAEEIKAPQRDLPLGMFLSFAIVNLLYMAVVFVTAGALDGQVLAGSLTPLSAGAQVAMGAFGAGAIGPAAFPAYATTGNAGILSASRSPMAMSRDGLLPQVAGPHGPEVPDASCRGAADLGLHDLRDRLAPGLRSSEALLPHEAAWCPAANIE